MSKQGGGGILLNSNLVKEQPQPPTKLIILDFCWTIHPTSPTPQENRFTK